MSREITAWGGSRMGAGRKGAWRSGKTKAYKLPEAIASEVLDLARAIDAGQKVEIVDESKYEMAKRLVKQIRELQVRNNELLESLSDADEHIEELRVRVSSMEEEGLSLARELIDTQIEYSNLERELAETKIDAASTKQPEADLEALRDRALSQLKLGRQAAGYKTAQKALDNFIAGLTA